MMVNSKTYKGIDYIRVSDLPQDQQDLVATTLNKNMIIKILINGKLTQDCLQFIDYKTWFENIYNQQSVATPEVSAFPKRQTLQDIPSHFVKKILVNS